MILTETVKVKIINLNKEHYVSKGYKCKTGDTIEVKVNDLSPYSKIKITLLCDNCKQNTKTIPFYYTTKFSNSKNGFYLCDKCKKEQLLMRKCDICGDTNGVTNYLNKGKFLCARHRSHIREYGSIMKNKHDKNEIRIFDDYIEFDTYDKNNNVNGIFKADLDLLDFIKTHKIYKHHSGYATYKDKDNYNKNIRLHRYIMNVHLEFDNKTVVDHINRDKSDNRKKNLRLVPFLDNAINSSDLSTNTSGHKGISFNDKSNKWEAYIHKNNKKIHLGRYDDFDEAIKIREIAEIVIFGITNPKYNELINKYINDFNLIEEIKNKFKLQSRKE